jgi:hypothetical protein
MSSTFLHEEKTLTYPGFEPGTFGFQVGNATNWTIEVVIWESLSKKEQKKE